MSIRRTVAQAIAPIRVEFSPINILQRGQVIYCWSFADALAWAKCAFNSDQVTISARFSGQVLARRASI